MWSPSRPDFLKIEIKNMKEDKVGFLKTLKKVNIYTWINWYQSNNLNKKKPALIAGGT